MHIRPQDWAVALGATLGGTLLFMLVVLLVVIPPSEWMPSATFLLFLAGMGTVFLRAATGRVVVREDGLVYRHVLRTVRLSREDIQWIAADRVRTWGMSSAVATIVVSRRGKGKPLPLWTTARYPTEHNDLYLAGLAGAMRRHLDLR